MQITNSNINTDFQMNYPFQYPFANFPQLSMYGSTPNLQNSMVNNYISQNWSIPNKLIKTSLYVSSSNLPQHIKNSLIQNLLVNNNPILQNISQNNLLYNVNISETQDQAPKLNVNSSIQNSPRVLFKKEEDEKIKKLVKVFGTRHWDLVAQFMERTAKQCRERYSNYLIPGFFQGEWSDEEDSLLIKLYEENGPRWSVIKKSFKNRSANNIKNRWYYFLRKKYHSLEENEKKEKKQNERISESKIQLNENETCNIEEEDQLKTDDEKIEGVDYHENESTSTQNENEIFEIFNNIDIDGNWMFYN